MFVFLVPALVRVFAAYSAVPPGVWRHQLSGVAMPQMCRKYDLGVRWPGLCRVVEETKKLVAAVAGELGANSGGTAGG